MNPPKSRKLLMVASIVLIVLLVLLAVFLPRLANVLGLRDEDGPGRTPRAVGRHAPPPPDCLVSGEIMEIERLCGWLGEILGAFDDRAGAQRMRQTIGRWVRNPDFSGMDLSQPIRFHLLNPKKYPQPWVFQFAVEDAARVRQALAAGEKGEQGELLIEGGRAVWAYDADAARTVAAWQKARPGGVEILAAGQVRVRIDVKQIMKAYPEEIDAQVRVMKDRMARALNRADDASGRKKDVARAQSELKTVFSALRQVGVAHVGFGMKANRAEMTVRVETLAGTGLAGLVRSHAPATDALLRACPPDADIVVAHNISVMNAVKNLVGNVLGLGETGLFEGGSSKTPGQTLLALMLPRNERTKVEILELRDGGRVKEAEERWMRLSAEDGKGPPRAIRFDPIPIEGLAETQGPVRMGRLVPNEAVLGKRGTSILATALGQGPQVVMARRDDRSFFCIAASPLSRIGEAITLAGSGGRSLATERRFAAALRDAGGTPNLLVYASPAAVRHWLFLGGFRVGIIRVMDEGLAGWVTFVEGGAIDARLHVPTAALRRALREETRPRPGPDKADPDDDGRTPYEVKPGERLET